MGMKYVEAYKKMGRPDSTVILTGSPNEVFKNVHESLHVLDHK